MQVTQLTPDIKKNKSKEKDWNFPQEHAPHYTGTLDYYFFQKHSWKREFNGGGGGNMVVFG